MARASKKAREADAPIPGAKPFIVGLAVAAMALLPVRGVRAAEVGSPMPSVAGYSVAQGPVAGSCVVPGRGVVKGVALDYVDASRHEIQKYMMEDGRTLEAVVLPGGGADVYIDDAGHGRVTRHVTQPMGVCRDLYGDTSYFDGGN